MNCRDHCRGPGEKVTFAIALGLGASLCWGTADFFGGVQSRRLPALAVALWSQLAGGVALLVALLAQGERPTLHAVAFGLVAGAFAGSGLLAFYRGLAEGAMSVVAPLSACAGVVPVVAAALGGTPPTAAELLGMVVAIAGVVLVSRSTTTDQRSRGRPGLMVALALYSALGFGVYFTLVHAGSQGPGGSPLWAVTAGRGGSLLVLLTIAAARRARLPWPGRRLAALTSIGVLDTGANLLFAYGSIKGNLGVVGVLSSLYPVATVVLARMVLAERLSFAQNVGVVLALAGVALLAVG
jgi:drug/metabolite transporter (DMT)-like permease